jgi:ABC-type nickel/cobalt efflux system permease component RcnA
LAQGGNALGHPIPRNNHDRTIGVRLSPGAVVVRYRLELDESQTARDLQGVDLSDVSTPEDLYKAYTEYMAPVLSGNLAARLDGKPLTFTCERQGYQVLDHLRCEFVFRAEWQLGPGPHAFTFREGNFDLDNLSRLVVTLEPGPGVTVSDVTAPDAALQQRPPLQRRSGDGERLRRLAATVELGGRDRVAGKVPTMPPDREANSPKPEGDAKSEPPPSMLRLVLDDRRSFAVLLLVMAGLGAAHALTPGHGKTLVAAYLVGERGTVWHALILGLVTTFTHTGAVLALAGVGWFFPDLVPATVQATQLVGGLLIALLGIWLLLRRLSGRADHVHLGGHGHHHHHHHDHDHGHGHDHSHDHVHLPPGGTTVGWWHLVVLGMHGGIVPCWDAIVILTLGISAGRLRVALPMLLAFSAGLAGVLVALGVGVVWARRWAGARWGHHPRLRRLVRLMPVASALVITAMGLWLCYDSTHPPTAMH